MSFLSTPITCPALPWCSMYHGGEILQSAGQIQIQEHSHQLQINVKQEEGSEM